MIDIQQGDCLELIKNIKDKSIDLILTDPPYLIENTTAGGNSDFSRSFQKMNTEIQSRGLTDGFNIRLLDEFMRVMKVPNIYIWCNIKQIPLYLDYFVNKHGCKFDILIWNKVNAPPTFNNKYLTDKEYCLYFRKGGYCNPANYEDAKTVWYLPINIKDKEKWKHPTIKPLSIIETLIRNSSKEGDVVLDTFLGSGTTMVACKNLNRDGIGFELDEGFYKVAYNRLNEDKFLELETEETVENKTGNKKLI